LGNWDLGPSSEKGSSRKHTENRVTRWRKLFRGNLNWDFFEVVGGNPRGVTEEGGPLGAFWGNFGELSCKCEWGDLWLRGFAKSRLKDEAFGVKGGRK
jgi:hypothetical protein